MHTLSDQSDAQLWPWQVFAIIAFLLLVVRVIVVARRDHTTAAQVVQLRRPDPTALCMVQRCPNPHTTSVHGWKTCGRCAEEMAA